VYPSVYPSRHPLISYFPSGQPTEAIQLFASKSKNNDDNNNVIVYAVVPVLSILLCCLVIILFLRYKSNTKKKYLEQLQVDSRFAAPSPAYAPANVEGFNMEDVFAGNGEEERTSGTPETPLSGNAPGSGGARRRLSTKVYIDCDENIFGGDFPVGQEASAVRPSFEALELPRTGDFINPRLSISRNSTGDSRSVNDIRNPIAMFTPRAQATLSALQAPNSASNNKYSAL